ncbi:MAG: hypothetical protein WED10_09470 [Brumimicrobium sp.]
MKLNNKNESHNYWGWIILSAIIALILVFWILFKYKRDKKRIEWLQHRKRKLRSVIQKKRNQKRWLDWAFRLIYPIARFILIGLWVGYNCLATYYFEQPIELEDLINWNAAGLILLTAVVFLIIGPFDFTKALKTVRPTIEVWVYGKYLGIGDMISADEDELAEIDKEIDSLNNN